jgi:hypothetical protein
MEIFLYFVTVYNILRPFGGIINGLLVYVVCGHLVYFFDLVCSGKVKSGNPAPDFLLKTISVQLRAASAAAFQTAQRKEKKKKKKEKKKEKKKAGFKSEFVKMSPKMLPNPVLAKFFVAFTVKRSSPKV